MGFSDCAGHGVRAGWRRVRSAFLAGLLVTQMGIPSAAVAEPLPGADDPALRAAALRWLNRENPVEALAEIGQMAAEGNVAAQLFANGVFYSNTVTLDGLTPDALRELFPPSPDAAPRRSDDARYTRPRRDEEGPFLEWRRSDDATAEQWSTAIAGYFEAGRVYLAQFGIEWAMPTSAFPARIAEEAPRYFHSGEAMAEAYWRTLFFEMYEREAAWWRFVFGPWFSVPPAELLKTSGFYEAVEDGLWPAVFAAAIMARDLSEAPDRVSDPSNDWVADLAAVTDHPNVVRVVRARRAYDTRRYRLLGPGPTAEDLLGIGRMVEAGLDRTPYLQPMVGACAQACGEQTTICIGAASVLRVRGRPLTRWLEPMLEADVVHASERAVDEVLARIVEIARDPDWAQPLPGCIVDFARARFPQE